MTTNKQLTIKTRTSRTREETNRAYHRVLLDLWTNHHNGVQERLSYVCARHHINKMSKAMLPDDLYIRKYEDVTLEYTINWRRDKQRPMHKSNPNRIQATAVQPTPAPEVPGITAILNAMARDIAQLCDNYEQLKTTLQTTKTPQL